MSLIHPTILYGLGLGLIPIVLHFLMRPRPRKLMFPALRLIQVHRKTNKQRMRLRHIWLLLLRIALIGLLVIAVARPRFPPANYALSLRETMTLLAILGVAAVAYWGVLSFWRKKRLPNHALSYRRSMLRGGTSIVAIVLLLLLVAWPYQRRVAAEIAAPLPERALDLPVSAVFLFDSSLSMQYRLESKTRLEVAQQIASEQLSSVPVGSRVAVADTSSDNPILFQADLTVAQARVDALEIRPVSIPLNDRLRAALQLQEEDSERMRGAASGIPEEKQSDRYLREIFLFTDMARSGWRSSVSSLLREELKRLSFVSVYLIDVGVEDPMNVGITSLSLSQQTLTTGRELKVTATISATGIQAGERTVELFVRQNSDSFAKRGQATVTLDPNSAARVTIPIRGLTEPLNQGELRLISSDPLAFDDKTSFTVAVRPPPNVLIVGEANRHIDSQAYYLSAALAPADEQFARASGARSRITYLPATKLKSESGTLEEYDVVCLVNVRHPTERTWEALKSYVASGGGLLVVMGMPNGSNPPSAVAYNLPIAQSILPAELLADLRFKPPENLDIKQRTHPIFSEIDELGDFSELTSVNIHRYWRVKPAADASVIANYSDERSSPAILERVHGKGRTLMYTTALDLNGWNDFPRVWQFVVMADEMVQYLGRFARNAYNYTAGEEVVVSLDPSKPLRRYLLRKPNLEQLPGDIAPNAESLTVRSVDQIGSYQLINAPGEPSFITGFSVNPPPGESDFTRMTTDDLDKLLGENRYSVSRDIAGLIRNVEGGRIGQEIFSLVMFCMILVFCCEHIVANRFYDAEQNVGHL